MFRALKDKKKIYKKFNSNIYNFFFIYIPFISIWSF